MKSTAMRVSIVLLAVAALGVTVICEPLMAAEAKKAPAKPAKPTKPKDPAFEAFKKKAKVPVVKVPLVPKAPKIDGVLDKKVYAKCEPMKFRFITGGSAKPTAATTAYAVTTKKELCLFFKCESPDMDALLKDVREHDGQVWNDDCIELFIDPTNKRQLDGYMHIIVNALGTTSEAKGPGGAEDYSWNPKLTVKTKVGKKDWTVEMSIPLAELVKDVKKINRAWAVNLNRMAYLIEGNEDTAWSPTGQSSSHVPSRFGILWLEAGKVDNTKK